ncbi:copper transporter [Peptacetobacter sp.]|uniref:copper transporter n=1 Tax=Peptacetobacter sp. TaxID=2991975 RepID=UPI002605F523|nr:copper transporter [Peptacetobacter sp.]
MHINMKYYIVSIGAIFLALGIGILVGFNLNNNEEISKQQANIIKQLDEEFNDIKEENSNLKKELNGTDKKYNALISYVNKNADSLMTGSLTDKNVAVISTYEKSENVNTLKNIINEYGGSLAFDLTFNKEITDEKIIKEAAKKTGEKFESTADIVNYTFDMIKRGNNESLNILKDLKIININSENGEIANFSSAIILAPSESSNPNEKFNKLDKFVVSKLKSQNKYIVEAQTTKSKTSYVEQYAKNKVATVDNIDEKTGTLSLVSLVQDENLVGNFGRLDTASSLIPMEK